MKSFTLSMVSMLALASLGSGAAARPFPQTQAQAQDQPGSQSQPSGQQSSQTGSAGGFGGSASATQNNDYSQVAPGNQVSNGGGQSASLQGLSGTLMQGANLGSLFGRRQAAQQDASAGGYAGTSNAYQNSVDSEVAPGNSVQYGESQSASNQGVSSTISQLAQGSGRMIRRMVPNDPSQFFDMLGSDVELPTEIVARDVSNDGSGIHIVSTKFGPVSSYSPATTGSQDGGEQHTLPHYMGLGPEVQPEPRPAL